MARRFFASSAALLLGLSLGAPALSHPLDELAQSSYLTLEDGSVRLEVGMTPGERVTQKFLALGDLTSNAGRRDFGNRIGKYLSASVDGRKLPLTLETADSALPAQGPGVLLSYRAALPSLSPGPHTLRYENRFEPFRSGYLSTALLGSGGVRLGQMERDPRQQSLTFAFTPPDKPASLSSPLVIALIAVAIGGGFGVFWLARRSRR